MRKFTMFKYDFFPIVSIADSIDKYLQCKMSKSKIPGLSLAIVKDGQIIKTKGYGFANVELKSPANSNTIYQSGSIGKQFTAALTMMLVENGPWGVMERPTDLRINLKLQSLF